MTYSEYLDYDAVRAAYTAIIAGATPTEQICAADDAAMGPAHEPSWDGTLTSAWEANGLIDREQAENIREKVQRRHEETDYDDLLARGVDRETARTMCND